MITEIVTIPYHISIQHCHVEAMFLSAIPPTHPFSSFLSLYIGVLWKLNKNILKYIYLNRKILIVFEPVWLFDSFPVAKRYYLISNNV